MPAKLYVVHGSHPCATAEKAFALKGVPVKLVEIPPPGHFALMRVLFGGHTVPAARFEDGEKVQGSTKILRALERRVPEPRLYTSPEVEEAERWGDEVFQPVARRVLWPAFARAPRAMHAFQEGQKAPKLPMAAVAAAAPVIVALERRINRASDDALRADLQALPGHLDHVDALIADGVLNGEQPNAADLQIAPTIRLLMKVADLRPLIAGRPAEAFTERWFPREPGEVPAGTLPAEWLPQPQATAATT
jgi:glutathione S-transferase